MNYLRYLTLSSCMVFAAQAQEPHLAEKNDSIVLLKEVTLSANVIFGSKFQAKNRTGSAYYMGPEELKKFAYTDINRALKAVPGVNIYEEDGFGLRPNISLRGASPERSAKITLMEDGVLIAPAPYSAPAAYYFPNIARMNAVEILKGSSQILYGPFTTDGVINFISAPLPDRFSAKLEAAYGTFHTSRLYASVGDAKENLRYGVDYLNYRSDGFKQITGRGSTGFNRNDVTAKFNLLPASASKGGEWMTKFQYSNEDSNETYLGLTDADFKETPFRRYAASQKDNITAEHIQFMTTYTQRFHQYARLTATGYYNGFVRNWYRLSDVAIDGEKIGIAAVVRDPLAYNNAYQALSGNLNTAANTLLMRSNNRSYQSKGIQVKWDHHFTSKNMFHDLEAGIRYHYDEEDRFQQVDGYEMADGQMFLTSAGAPGSDANRINSANALATYILYKLTYQKLTLTPGIRYEDILLQRFDYGTSDPARLGLNATERENKVAAWIPGMGFHYTFHSHLSLFGGVHRGFAPPGNRPGQQPEKSINAEVGSRFQYKAFSGEITGFYNHYTHLLGSDLAASGGSGSSELFNAGKVAVRGIEVLLHYNPLSKASKTQLPVTIGYTFTDSEFLEDFTSEEGLWGAVTAGDELPYLVKHQLYTALELEHPVYELSITGKYNSAFRTQADSGTIPDNQAIQANFIIDIAGAYHWSRQLSVTGIINNLLDEVYAVSRAPAGLRPGMPLSAQAGLRFQF